MKSVLLLMGTRPEVIKLAPLVLAIKKLKSVSPVVCLTGQHAQMAEQMLAHFGLKSDVTFDVQRAAGNLTALVAGVASQLATYLANHRPDMILVQGDTTSAMLGAMSGFYEKIPVAHVEAGLRSHDLTQPYPEEYNRRVISIGADINFCPTKVSASNLLREGVKKKLIHVVGNTCIDSLLWTLENTKPKTSPFTPGKRGILVTGHRRENWENGLTEMCNVILRLVKCFPDIEVVYPVHPNPVVKLQVENLLSGVSRMRLTEPMPYDTFCHAMKDAHLIISDSGGVQEEALALGTPVLVTRNLTERPEVLKWETVRLVGDSHEKLWKAAHKLLSSEDSYRKAAKPHFPFGRGNSSTRITKVLAKSLQ